MDIWAKQGECYLCRGVLIYVTIGNTTASKNRPPYNSKWFIQGYQQYKTY